MIATRYRITTQHVKRMPLLLIFTLAVFGVVGDSLLKLSAGGNKGALIYFLLGVSIYAVSGVGWFFVMKHIPLGTIGVYYSIATAVLLVIIGVFFFKETIRAVDLLALCFALVSLFLLRRFE